MHARHLIAHVLYTLLALSAVGCGVDYDLTSPPPLDEVVEQSDELLVACDWREPDACPEAGYQCDPIIDDGTHLETGYCTKAQGSACTEYEARGLILDRCGRGLSCKVVDPEAADFRCLPSTCLVDSECAPGEVCTNAVCLLRGPGCPELQ